MSETSPPTDKYDNGGTGRIPKTLDEEDNLIYTKPRMSRRMKKQ